MKSALLVAPLGKALTPLANIRLCWKGLPWTMFKLSELVINDDEKNYITLIPGADVIDIF
jgi:hypothetical protein